MTLLRNHQSQDFPMLPSFQRTVDGVRRQIRRHRPQGYRHSCLLLLVGTAIGLSGCENLTGSPGLPSGTPNPSFYNTKAGAIGMYTAAVFAFEAVIPHHVIETGLLTDELEDANQQPSQGQQVQLRGQVPDPLDERFLPQGGDAGADDYEGLQTVREFANQAIGALAKYDTATFYDTAAVDSAQSQVYRGTLYAFEGYAELWLADFSARGCR